MVSASPTDQKYPRYPLVIKLNFTLARPLRSVSLYFLMEIFSQMIGACIFKIIAKFIVHSIALYMSKDIDLMYGIFQKKMNIFT